MTKPVKKPTYAILTHNNTLLQRDGEVVTFNSLRAVRKEVRYLKYMKEGRSDFASIDVMMIQNQIRHRQEMLNDMELLYPMECKRQISRAKGVITILEKKLETFAKKQDEIDSENYRAVQFVQLRKNNMIDNGPPPDTIDSVVTKKEIIMDDYDLMLDEYDRWNEAGELLYQHWLRETDEGMDLINEWALAAAEADAIELEMENV